MPADSRCTRASALTLVALILLGSLVASAAPPNGPARLDGTWKLDWDRSDSFEPVMEALEVSWLLRRLAGIASVRVELQAMGASCEGCAERIQVIQHTPLSTDEIEVILDGEPRPGKDARGRPTVDRYTWSADQGLEMIRELDLPSGSHARLEEKRNLGDGPDDIVSLLKVWVDGVERAAIRRSLRRIED